MTVDRLGPNFARLAIHVAGANLRLLSGQHFEDLTGCCGSGAHTERWPSGHDLPLRGVDAIRHEMRILETNPYTCRKVASNPLERELVIPFGGSGCVALFEIVCEHEVVVSASRHQREDDYH